MPVIQLDALDTLFFRDSKDFTKGQDTWANTMFPPHPSVIYGALRSAYFAEHIGELDQATKYDDPTKDLVIKNICLKQGDDFYFPLPLDCVQEKGWSNIEDKKNKVFVLTPSPMREEIISSCPVRETIQNDKQVENVPDGIIGESALENYLKGKNELNIKKRSCYLLTEPKIGIARSKHTHTSDEGMLYRVGMNRLSSKKNINETLSLIVDFDFNFKSEEKNQLPTNGLMKIGGEGKAVKYEKMEKETITISKPEITNDKFKLYISTPAIFENGWLPKSFDKDSLEGFINGVKVKLLMAAIGKPISIGGWDIKKGCPKMMRKAVPAGSVYYFELIEGDISKLHGKSISDYNEKEGFGIAYVGAIL